MSRLTIPRNIILLVAAISLITVGVSYALVQITKNVNATVIVEPKFPDGIKMFSDEGLT